MQFIVSFLIVYRGIIRELISANSSYRDYGNARAYVKR